MEKIVVASAIVGIELTEEEITKVLAERERKAKHEEAERLLDGVKELVKVINDLGYSVRIGEIGGKYVWKHEPWVECSELHLRKK